MHGISRLMAMTATLVAALLSVLCCSKESLPGVPDNANFRMSFAVPVDSKAYDNAQYGDALNNEGNDNKLTLNDIAVYFFKPDGSFVSVVDDFREIRLSASSSSGYNPHYHLYDAVMHVEGIENGADYRVVVVANRRSAHSSSLPFCCPQTSDWKVVGTGATDEEKLYSTLEFNYSSVGAGGINSYINLNFSLDDRAYVPMWGFAQVRTYTKNAVQEGVAPEDIPLSGTINMLRSVAKVRINIAPGLLDFVEPTVFDPATGMGGIRLYNPVQTGYMTPAYNKVASLPQTPEILDKDRQGGVPGASFTDAWVNRGASAETPMAIPFFKQGDSYYTYLPEAYIGQCSMGLEFRWKDPAFLTPVTHDYRLEFADYEAASADLLGGKDIPLTAEQLLPYRFPVMRNHYYIYTVQRLNPMELKFEVCDWQQKNTNISFN